MAKRMRFLTAWLSLLLAACSTSAGPSAGIGTAAPDQPSPPATPRTEATHTASPSPTIEPSYSPTASPLGSPLGAAVFSDPDSCTNPELGYRVAYPATWYSNPAVPNLLSPAAQGLPACYLFAPTDFAVVYGTEISSDVAIWFRSYDPPPEFEWDFGPPINARIASSAETEVADRWALYQELEIVEPDYVFEPGDRIARYIIEVAERSYLIAETHRGRDYVEAKSMLDQMMLTLEIVSP